MQTLRVSITKEGVDAGAERPRCQGEHTVTRGGLHFHGKANPPPMQEQGAVSPVTARHAVTCFTHRQILTQSLPEAKLGPGVIC